MAMSETDKNIPVTNVLVVGVGGQGVIMISKVLAELCQMQGYDVKQSEVHGMAKRGGSVFSHVRFGSEVWSPTIPMGKADILLALEWAEGLRWLNFLKPDDGTFIADTQHIVPPFACLDRKRGATLRYSTETPKEVLENVEAGFALNATDLAEELGNSRAANTVLLGVLSAALDFPKEDWITIISKNVPPATIDINCQAFEGGRDWAIRMKENPLDHAEMTANLKTHQARPPELIEAESELRITREWCKSCNICVTMCPERCLSLDEDKIVVLSKPDKCTGCRVCEWLCPDFAIDVIKNPQLKMSA